MEGNTQREPLLQNRFNMDGDGHHHEDSDGSVSSFNLRRRRGLSTQDLMIALVAAFAALITLGTVLLLFSRRVPAFPYDDRVILSQRVQLWALHAHEQEHESVHPPDGEDQTFESEGSTLPLIQNAPICKLSDYEIHEEIGKGGFGKVYLATKKSGKSTVAIKAYQDSKKGKKQYDLERVFLQALRNHPYIIQLHCAFVISPKEAETAELEGRYMLVMEYASKGSMFKRRMERGAPVRKWFAQLVLALEYVHSKKILHQDIKAGNVLIDDNNDIRLADFGLAAKLPPPGEPSRWVGTKIYFPPERVRREPVSYSADIYSLGILLYHFYGQNPLPRFNKNEEDKEVIKAELLKHSMNSHKWPLIKNSPKQLKDLYSRMTEPDPKKRITLGEIKDHPYFKGVEWNPIKTETY